MKTMLSSMNKRFIDFCLKNRLGKSNFAVRVIYFFVSIFSRFEGYKNSEELGRKGHYIPQFLLRRFRLAESGTKRGVIFQYNFLLDELEESSIKDVVQIEDFYIFKQKGGGLSDYVEKELFASFIEGFGNRVIKTINISNGDPELTLLEQNILATFIAHQITRTPKFYLSIRRFVLFLYGKGLLRIEDLGNTDFLRRVVVKNKHGVNQEDILNHHSIYTLEGDKNHLGHISRLVAEEIQEEIFSRNFNFLIISNEKNQEFVLSDNPVIFVDFSKHEVMRFPAWWELKRDNLWIMMPISPEKSLLITRQSRGGGNVEVDHDDLIKLLNFGQYLNALCYVYGRSDLLIEEHLKFFRTELLKQRELALETKDLF